MAKLSAFRSDTKSIQDGMWIRVDEMLYDDIEILTRGYTDEFVDAQTARLARAAIPFGGDQARLPNATRRQINAQLLREFLVLDVRNLKNDDGTDVTIGDFLDLIADPAYYRLSRACFDAAARVTAQSADQLAAAVGNSANALPGN